MPTPARILVVEDETRIAEVVEGCLQAQGHTVIRSATGEEALAAAVSRRPDLAILDLGLPGMPGVDSARRRVTLDGAAVELTESESLQGMEFQPNLRHKLGDDARAPRLVLTVYGRGYVLSEDQR